MAQPCGINNSMIFSLFAPLPFQFIEHLIQNSDGEITIEDAKKYWHKVKKLLTNKIPDAGGFSLGFLYGITYS